MPLPTDSLVTIPAGRWRVGGRSDEAPLRIIELAAFRAAVAPVTNAQFRAFQAATQHPPLPFEDEARLSVAEQPVVGVSWADAVAYLAWLAESSGVPVRLPTEDEREVAARGGLVGQPWPWGATEPEERPELAELAQRAQPHAPGPDCANGYGLRCMADNVHEWCSDAVSARGGRPARRASRGGSWRHRRPFTPVHARSSLPPALRYSDYGFRVYSDA